MAETGRRRRTKPLAPTEANDQPLVALVVDDDEATRESLRLSLSLDGWTVEEATSGEDAIEAWHRTSPQVILLDQNLPGMTGLECAAKLRELADGARIILFSGYLDAEASREARRLRLLPLAKAERTRLFELMGLLADQVRSAASRVS
jgi:CheY-like chemotaxis protein